MKAVFRFMLGLIPIASLFILLCCYNNQLNQLSSDDKLDKDLGFMIFLLFGGSFLMSFVTGAFVIKLSNTRRIFILLVYFFIFAFLIYLENSLPSLYTNGVTSISQSLGCSFRILIRSDSSTNN